MNAPNLRTLTSNTASIRAALARMVEGAVFELPSNDLRDRFVDVQKIIAWRKEDGSIDLRTWDESIYKGPTRWSLDANGRLLDNGAATSWFVYDLRPTGENAIECLIDALPDDDDDDEAAPTHRRTPQLRIVGGVER